MVLAIVVAPQRVGVLISPPIGACLGVARIAIRAAFTLPQHFPRQLIGAAPQIFQRLVLRWQGFGCPSLP